MLSQKSEVNSNQKSAALSQKQSSRFSRGEGL
jgi:hypothetical protein